MQDPTGQAVQDSAGPAGRGPVAVGEAVTLAGRTPGDSRTGMIVFEVPEGAVPAKFQFALDSGFAEQKGEWTLS